MTPEPPDWTVPAPLRALLWWPPVALVVAMIEPSAAVGTIAVSGAVLAGLGVLVAAVGRALARRVTTSSAPTLTVIEGSEAPAPIGLEQRAA